MTIEASIRARFLALPTAAISDALDSLDLRGSLLGIFRRTGSRAAGRAFTVRYELITDEPGTVGDFLDDVTPGEMIVIDNSGRVDCTVWGGIMSRVAAARGVAGTVINGACRDISASEEAHYSIWSAGHFMRTGKDRVRCVAVQQPVVIDGVVIAPGDYVIADADGVAVVPSARVLDVLERSEHIEYVENRIVHDATSGSTLRHAREQSSYHALQERH